MLRRGALVAAAGSLLLSYVCLAKRPPPSSRGAMKAVSVDATGRLHQIAPAANEQAAADGPLGGTAASHGASALAQVREDITGVASDIVRWGPYKNQEILFLGEVPDEGTTLRVVGLKDVPIADFTYQYEVGSNKAMICKARAGECKIDMQAHFPPNGPGGRSGTRYDMQAYHPDDTGIVVSLCCVYNSYKKELWDEETLLLPDRTVLWGEDRNKIVVPEKDTKRLRVNFNNTVVEFDYSLGRKKVICKGMRWRCDDNNKDHFPKHPACRDGSDCAAKYVLSVQTGSASFSLCCRYTDVKEPETLKGVVGIVLWKEDKKMFACPEQDGTKLKVDLSLLGAGVVEFNYETSLGRKTAMTCRALAKECGERLYLVRPPGGRRGARLDMEGEGQSAYLCCRHNSNVKTVSTVCS